MKVHRSWLTLFTNYLTDIINMAAEVNRFSKTAHMFICGDKHGSKSKVNGTFVELAERLILRM